MRAYLAYFSYSKLLQAAFIPILLFTLIAGAIGAFSTVEYEGRPSNLNATSIKWRRRSVHIQHLLNLYPLSAYRIMGSLR